MNGTLRRQPSGRWAIVDRAGGVHEITSGEVFHVEVAGAEKSSIVSIGMRTTRMEFAQSEGGYYSVDGFVLRDGLRAATHSRSDE